MTVAAVCAWPITHTIRGCVKDVISEVLKVKCCNYLSLTTILSCVCCAFLPSLHRFVNHTRKGLTVLLHNWIPLMLALESSINSNSQRFVSASMRGLLKKLKSPNFLSTTCLLKKIVTIFEGLSLKLEHDPSIRSWAGNRAHPGATP
eukprot:scpid25361/ scgid31551/ 